MNHTPRRSRQERARRRTLADAAADGTSTVPNRRQARFTPLERQRRRNLADIASGFEPQDSENTSGGLS